MEESIRATIKKVAKITGELIWIRAAVLTLAAALFLIFSEISDFNSDMVDLKIGQSQIVATLHGLDERLGSVEQRLGSVEQRLGSVERRLETLESQATQQ